MNSPWTTADVGTSIAALPPNAPPTAAIAATIATAASERPIVRLLLRHMPLHRHTRLQARRDNHFVIAHRAERDRLRPRAAAIEHAHAEPTFALRASVGRHDGIARHDEDVVS